MNNSKVYFPIIREAEINCGKYGAKIKVYQYEITEPPSGECKKCHEYNYARFDTKTGKAKSLYKK